MQDQQNETLTFDRLDDLTLASSLGKLGPQHLMPMQTAEVGPMVELLHLLDTVPALTALVTASPSFQRLREANLSREAWGAHRGSGVSVMPFTRSAEDPQETRWIQWLEFARDAAERAGFEKKTAYGLTASIMELEENVFEHSERPYTGLVAFRTTPGEFEFVIADRGVGTLSSLRRSSDFSALRDAGEALASVIRPGVSRHGLTSGHGFGFRDLFTALANQRGSLRFRSDNFVATIEGDGPAPERVVVSPRLHLSGFLVSVLCRPTHR